MSGATIYSPVFTFFFHLLNILERSDYNSCLFSCHLDVSCNSFNYNDDLQACQIGYYNGSIYQPIFEFGIEIQTNYDVELTCNN